MPASLTISSTTTGITRNASNYNFHLSTLPQPRPIPAATAHLPRRHSSHHSTTIPFSDSASEPPLPCRYSLDTTSSASLTLPDGRRFGYAEYGALRGRAIIYLYGLPGSRLEAAFLDATASKLRARIIAIDRPSIGQSSPHPDRTLLDHAHDIEHLTTHLGLTKYGVLGISGGGPYALACARALPPERLRAVSIVCGIGSPDMGYAGMNLLSWMGWTFGHRMFPTICRQWVSRWPAARLDLSDEERMRLLRVQFEKEKASMHPKDLAVFSDADLMVLYLRSSREVFAQGENAFMQDARIMNADWGFKVEDIRKNLPVQLQYGKIDTYVPLHHGEKIAARLGENARLRVEDDTHASISADWKEEYLGDLVRAIEA